MRVSFVPKAIGPEKTALNPPVKLAGDDFGQEFTAFSGTMFNQENVQHRHGSSGLRYAIAIQMARDAKDFSVADEMRRWVQRVGYRVANGRDRTTLIADFSPEFFASLLPSEDNPPNHLKGESP